MNELVSIIIPLYNQGEYIEETLNSVKQQSYSNYELIIVDDGSNDQFTIEKIKELRFKGYTIISKQNGGLASARNEGIRNATGKYIIVLDSDDIIHRDYIKNLLEVITNTKARIVYSKALLFEYRTGMWMLPSFTMRRMLKSNIIFCSAMYYREDWFNVGGYDESLRTGLEDWDFWLSLIGLYNNHNDIVARVNKPLFFYRIRRNSMLRSINYTEKEKIVNYIHKKHIQLFELYKVKPLIYSKQNLISKIFNKIA
ncbi:glycosyltransferase, partial [Escherichia coli]|nr:glycosyltransferase [Escherichia coli]